MGQVVVTSERTLGAGPDPADDRLVEQDADSSMVTTWDGAGGIGGFFERAFVSEGLQRIYDARLTKLSSELGT